MSRGGLFELASSIVTIVTLYPLGSGRREQMIQMSHCSLFVYYYDFYLKKIKVRNKLSWPYELYQLIKFQSFDEGLAMKLKYFFHL